MKEFLNRGTKTMYTYKIVYTTGQNSFAMYYGITFLYTKY